MMDITKSLLLTFGVGQVVGAQNGEQGFDRFCEYNNDIIIADWMMKPMDGISFTRKIRNDPKSPNPYVPVILIDQDHSTFIIYSTIPVIVSINGGIVLVM